jgi:hypothetical protein
LVRSTEYRTGGRPRPSSNARKIALAKKLYAERNPPVKEICRRLKDLAPYTLPKTLNSPDRKPDKGFDHSTTNSQSFQAHLSAALRSKSPGMAAHRRKLSKNH